MAGPELSRLGVGRRQTLALPIDPELTRAQQDYVANAVTTFVSKHAYAVKS